MIMLCSESPAQLFQLARRCQFFIPGCNFSKLPLWVQTERVESTNLSDIILKGFLDWFPFLDNSISCTVFFPRFMSVFTLSFKALVTSNNASILTPTSTPAFDLITGPYTLSLTLGFFKESCPETNSVQAGLSLLLSLSLTSSSICKEDEVISNII